MLALRIVLSRSICGLHLPERALPEGHDDRPQVERGMCQPRGESVVSLTRRSGCSPSLDTPPTQPQLASTHHHPMPEVLMLSIRFTPVLALATIVLARVGAAQEPPHVTAAVFGDPDPITPEITTEQLQRILAEGR